MELIETIFSSIFTLSDTILNFELIYSIKIFDLIITGIIVTIIWQIIKG